MEATVTCKDGSQREIELFAAAIGTAHVVVFIDLSEKNQAARRAS